MALRLLIPDLETPPRLPAGAKVVVAMGETMGSTWSVRVASSSLLSAELEAMVNSCLDTVIAQMSHWCAQSEISRFNTATVESWIRISPEFERVLHTAQAVARGSGGAFDPTMGALVDLWGFGPTKSARLPLETEIRGALARAGWTKLRFEEGAVHQPGGLHLDLSGIAKGFAVDLVFERLRDRGFDSLLVEIGGELRGVGVRPDGNPWWVEIESPPGSPFPPSRLALYGAAIATSGDYRRNFERDGRRLAHTLDPRTGSPVTHGMASVSVLADTAMTADAEATAIMVLGPRDGYDYALQRGLAALLVDRTDGAWREQITPALGAMTA